MEVVQTSAAVQVLVVEGTQHLPLLTDWAQPLVSHESGGRQTPQEQMPQQSPQGAWLPAQTREASSLMASAEKRPLVGLGQVVGTTLEETSPARGEEELDGREGEGANQ